MAWDAKAKKVAVKAIGKVESGLKYDSINYTDPITIGIAQWFGTRAANLLLKAKANYPREYSQIEGSLKDDLKSHPHEDTYWNRRYLTRAEGNSMLALLAKSAPLQDEQLIEDLEGYRSAAASAGIDVESNTDTFILFCVAWHQGPKYALQVCAAVGGDASLEAFRDGCLNNAVLGKYPNRYNEAYKIIVDQDSDGISGGTAGVEPSAPITRPGGDGAGGNQIQGNISYIERLSDNVIHVHTDAGVVVCPPQAGDIWRAGARNSGTVGVPQTGGAGGSVPPPTPPPAGEGATDVVEYYKSKLGMWAYSQGAGRLTPESTGYGDCSSTIRWAYKKIRGVETGTWTGDMLGHGKAIFPRTYSRFSSDHTAQMLPGDLLIIWWEPDSPAGADHVEMYMGGNKNIGHGGPENGPTIKNDTIKYMSYVSSWTVRRYV